MLRPGPILRGGRKVAVLLAADQAVQRSPTLCVRTGRPTTFATRTSVPSLAAAVWLELIVGHALVDLVARIVRRPRITVVLAVDQLEWRRWRGRLTRAVGLTAAGIGMIAVGLIVGKGAFVVFGVLIALLGWIARVRATLHAWVSLSYSAATGYVRVFRAHPGFDRAAQELFTRSVGGRQRRT
jgi:hypothetical protein